MLLIPVTQSYATELLADITSRLLKAPEMKIQKNARLTLLRREEVADSVIALRLTKTEAARDYGVLAKIVAQWVGRYRKEGRKGIVT